MRFFSRRDARSNDHGLDLFELEISVRVEPVETLHGFDSALSERFKQAQAGSIVLICY